MNKKTQDKIKKFLAYEKANISETPRLSSLYGDIPKQIDRTNPKNVKLVKDILLSLGFIQTSEHCFTKDPWDIVIHDSFYRITFRGARVGVGTYFKKLGNILESMKTDEELINHHKRYGEI